MGVTFTPISNGERNRLLGALKANALENKPMRMNPRDTSFEGIGEMVDGEVTDAEVINQVRSIPCHYSPGGGEGCMAEDCGPITSDDQARKVLSGMMGKVIEAQRPKTINLDRRKELAKLAMEAADWMVAHNVLPHEQCLFKSMVGHLIEPWHG